MIKQEFFIEEQILLTIYTENFDMKDSEPLIEQRDNFKLVESYKIDFQTEEIGFDEVTEGFLEVEHRKNPFSDYSTNFKEFIVSDKKGFINEYHDINPEKRELFLNFSEFVKEWSSYDLTKNPYSLFNTIIYYPKRIDIEMELSKENSNNVKIFPNFQFYQSKNESFMLRAIFKFNDLVIFSILDTFSISEKSFTLECKKEWNSLDIEVFENNEIIFARYKCSFVRSISLNLYVNPKSISKEISIPKKNVKNTIKLEKIGDLENIIVGEKSNPSKLISEYHQEKKLTSKLSKLKEFVFLKTNDKQKGLKKIEELSEMSFSELWVFDPYFIDLSQGKEMIDSVLSVLSKNIDIQKNIVFENKQKNTFEDFKKGSDKLVELLSKHNEPINFKFYGTKEHFHDRFIFLVNKTNIKGYIIGTSMNSFGENYSTLYKIPELFEWEIFTELKNNLLSSVNLELTETL